MTAGYSFLVLISACFIHSEVYTGKCGNDDVVGKVRPLLWAAEFNEEHAILVEQGEKAFPAFLQILTAKDVKPIETARIFNVLAKVKIDRSQFLEHAILGLSHEHVSVRGTAVQLIAQIGSARDIAPVVALLSDTEWTNSVAAAKTLATIGDKRALAAMDVWLNSATPRNSVAEKANELLRTNLTKYRDELKARLDKEKVKPPAK